MSSSLSRIPPPKRRQLAATLGLFAVLFVAVGAVAETGRSTGVIQAFVAIALVVALLLGLMAWGVAHSIKVDEDDARLDAVIEEAVAARGGRLCDCGHDHDPTELHVTDDPCEQDGHGLECTHSCTTCVLAALRPATVPAGAASSTAASSGAASSTATSSTAVASGSRPSPRPRRPSPSPTRP